MRPRTMPASLDGVAAAAVVPRMRKSDPRLIKAKHLVRCRPRVLRQSGLGTRSARPKKLTIHLVRPTVSDVPHPDIDRRQALLVVQATRPESRRSQLACPSWNTLPTRVRG